MYVHCWVFTEPDHHEATEGHGGPGGARRHHVAGVHDGDGLHLGYDQMIKDLKIWHFIDASQITN